MFLIISFILLFLAFFNKKDNYILNHFLFGYFVIYVFFNLYFNCYSYLSINYHDMFYLYFILFVIIGFILFENMVESHLIHEYVALFISKSKFISFALIPFLAVIAEISDDFERIIGSL